MASPETLLFLFQLIFDYSAFNARTNAYKNAAFDILFDHEASQGQIFADCGVPNLIKQVVEVSARGQLVWPAHNLRP